MAIYLFAFVLGYLLGSLPTGLWIARIGGVRDVRHTGSGGTGASNVTRARGWAAGMLVLTLDLGKGWIAAAWLPALVGTPTDQRIALLAGTAAIAGHVWPVWAGLRGGKGTATAGGVLLAVYPPAFALCAGLFALVVTLTRIASLGSLVAALALPLVLWLLEIVLDRPGSVALYGFSVTLAFWITWNHRTNITDLRRGRERRIGPGGGG